MTKLFQPAALGAIGAWLGPISRMRLERWVVDKSRAARSIAGG